MNPLSFVAFAQALPTPRDGFWPVTVVGWITTVGFIMTILGGVFALGKFYQALNGFGARLTDAEKALEESKGDRSAIHRMLERVLTQHEALIERLGENRRTTEKCSEDTVELGIQIGSKIDVLGHRLNEINLNLSQRIKAVETVLKIKGDN